MKKILMLLLLLASMVYVAGCGHKHRYVIFTNVEDITTLTVGTPVTGHIDVDKYTILLEKDKIYLFRTFNLSADMDTVLLLFDSTGVILAKNDNESESSLASNLQYQITETGTYCIVVRHEFAEANSGMYDLIVEFVSDAPDDDDCDHHSHPHTNTIGQGHECQD